ncbi:hypothetical protein BE20_42445 [Sorangium cellulosum]|uniref:SsuA/THI5-like domain-containing protein n=1 Tax=Sorangium cellulosum TaxID=56 RepID=A0A150RIW2_SORCE|nr:hypothetical protein BE18_26340 [Sorangium cellulosum]KYF96304.1 hypothetical protein BE20_42445 [Sorangium cellulosum]
MPTDQTPQTLRSGGVDAVVAWQPNSGQALRELPGSTAIFTSADVPGIVYDVLAVSPKSLAERRADWGRVVRVWDRIARFIKDERNLDRARGRAEDRGPTQVRRARGFGAPTNPGWPSAVEVDRPGQGAVPRSSILS